MVPLAPNDKARIESHCVIPKPIIRFYGEGGGRGLQDGEDVYTHVDVWQNQYNIVKFKKK